MVVAGVVCRGAGAVVVEVAGVVCRDAGVVFRGVVLEVAGRKTSGKKCPKYSGGPPAQLTACNSCNSPSCNSGLATSNWKVEVEDGRRRNINRAQMGTA